MFPKKYWLLAVVMFLALFLRLYRAADLTVFLADQGYMAGEILKMTRGDITLIGPVSSVGGFYNGPAMYYLNLPFFLLFGGEPIAGTVFQSLLSVATIPFIYLLGKKLKNETVGLIASCLFAVSPLMVDYSRAIFNTHPSVFFSTLIIYWLTAMKGKGLNLKALFLGVLAGINFQFHYLAIAMLLFAWVYPLAINQKLKTKAYYLWTATGFTLAMTPLILFELKNRFFNTVLILKYLFGSGEKVRSLANILTVWPEVMGKLIFGNDSLLGLIGCLLIASTVVFLYLKKPAARKNMNPYLWLWLVVLGMGLFYGGYLHSHYVISIHTTLFLLAAYAIYVLSKGRAWIILTVLGFLAIVNIPAWYLNKPMHPLQDGLKMEDFRQAALIIKNDQKTVYNVAMHAQGDNRAIPLRFWLLFYRENPTSYEEYVQVNELYFLIKNTEKIKDQTMWEYQSFGTQSRVVKKWQINDNYRLLKLVKNT